MRTCRTTDQRDPVRIIPIGSPVFIKPLNGIGYIFGACGIRSIIQKSVGNGGGNIPLFSKGNQINQVISPITASPPPAMDKNQQRRFRGEVFPFINIQLKRFPVHILVFNVFNSLNILRNDRSSVDHMFQSHPDSQIGRGQKMITYRRLIRMQRRPHPRCNHQ